MKVHLEYLYHFRCPNCDKWWSIGDWAHVYDLLEYANHVETRKLSCPHCQTEHVITELADGFDNVINLEQ